MNTFKQICKQVLKSPYVPILQLACTCANLVLTIGTNAYAVNMMFRLEDKIDKRFDKMTEDHIKLFKGHFDKLEKDLIRVTYKYEKNNREQNQ